MNATLPTVTESAAITRTLPASTIAKAGAFWFAHGFGWRAARDVETAHRSAARKCRDGQHVVVRAAR